MLSVRENKSAGSLVASLAFQSFFLFPGFVFVRAHGNVTQLGLENHATFRLNPAQTPEPLKALLINTPLSPIHCVFFLSSHFYIFSGMWTSNCPTAAHPQQENVTWAWYFSTWKSNICPYFSGCSATCSRAQIHCDGSLTWCPRDRSTFPFKMCFMLWISVF